MLMQDKQLQTLKHTLLHRHLNQCREIFRLPRQRHSLRHRTLHKGLLQSCWSWHEENQRLPTQGGQMHRLHNGLLKIYLIQSCDWG